MNTKETIAQNYAMNESQMHDLFVFHPQTYRMRLLGLGMPTNF